MGDSSRDPSLVQNLKGHKKTINALRYLPNQRDLLSCSDDHNLMLWNVSTKDARSFKFSGHTQQVTDLDYTSSRNLIASCSYDKTVRIWEPTVKGSCTQFIAHFSPVRTISLSPTDQQMVTGSNDKSIKLWNLPKKKFLNSFTGHNNWILCARYSIDGKYIVSSADDKTIKVWDPATKECVLTISNAKSSALKLSMHPNGTSIAAAMASGSVRVYDIRTKKLQQHYILHNKANDVCWHPMGKHMLSCGDDGSIKVLDALEGRPIYTLNGMSEGPITCLTFSPDGEYFACGGANKNIMIWQTNFIDSDENASEMQSCSSIN